MEMKEEMSELTVGKQEEGTTMLTGSNPEERGEARKTEDSSADDQDQTGRPDSKDGEVVPVEECGIKAQEDEDTLKLGEGPPVRLDGRCGAEHTDKKVQTKDGDSAMESGENGFEQDDKLKKGEAAWGRNQGMKVGKESIGGNGHQRTPKDTNSPSNSENHIPKKPEEVTKVGKLRLADDAEKAGAEPKPRGHRHNISNADECHEDDSVDDEVELQSELYVPDASLKPVIRNRRDQNCVYIRVLAPPNSITTIKKERYRMASTNGGSGKKYCTQVVQIKKPPSVKGQTSKSKTVRMSDKKTQTPKDIADELSKAFPRHPPKTPISFPDQKDIINPIAHTRFARVTILCCALFLAFFYTGYQKETKFAVTRENIQLRMQTLDCYQDEGYVESKKRFPECIAKRCGRFVSDTLVKEDEWRILFELAERLTRKSGAYSGAAIFDLGTGAMSVEGDFIDFYDTPGWEEEFKIQHELVYKMLRDRFRKAISRRFGIDMKGLFVGHPMYFTKLNNVEPPTVREQYWRPHADKTIYTSSFYTAILFLNNYDRDFYGGRFVFHNDGMESNKTVSIIEPKAGRVLVFTSGKENYHHVERVIYGERYSLVMTFTCDPEKAADDPIWVTPEKPWATPERIDPLDLPGSTEPCGALCH